MNEDCLKALERKVEALKSVLYMLIRLVEPDKLEREGLYEMMDEAWEDK